MKDSNTSTIRFDVAALAAGRTHTCVQKAGDLLECFGPDNAAGQLGGTPAGPTETATVNGTLGAGAFATGGDHACVVTAAGTARCWGANAEGQLGDGTTVQPAAGTLRDVSGR
jgi:alpha-tubulin suppressor-like RCC1 family protein